MRSPLLWLAVVLLATLGVYARSVGNDFVYDDRHYVMVPTEDGLPNHLVAEWQGLGTYMTSPYGAGAAPGGRGFRPVTVMSFAAVHQMFKPPPGPGQPMDRPGPQHFVNIALHVLATWLVFLLFRRLFESPWPAVAAAACFGLHALRSDPVISIVGRAEVLALCFGITAQLLYLTALARTGAARVLPLVGTAICLFLAFGSKESSLPWAAFLPLFAIACRWQRDASVPLGTVLEEQVVPLLIVAVAPVIVFLLLWYPILTTEGFSVVSVKNPIQLLEFPERFCTAVMILGHALFQVLLPFWLHADYSFNTFAPVENWYDYTFLGAFVVLLGILVGGLAVARRSPSLFLGMAMLFGFAFMTSNIPVIVETVYGERLMYTPAVGLCFLVAWVTDVVRRKRQRNLGRVLLGVALVWLAVSSIVIVSRCGVWKDNRTLFFHEAETQPRCQGLLMAAGREFRLEGQALDYDGPRGQFCLQKWGEYLDRAIAVHEGRNHPLPLNDLAYLHLVLRDKLLARGDLPNAEKEERIAEQLIITAINSPWFERTHGRNLHYQMSLIFERRGDRRGQLRGLELANQADPRDPDGYTRLADWHLQEGLNAKAVEYAVMAVSRFPDALPIRIRALEIVDAAGDSGAYVKLLEEGERRHPEGNPDMQIFRGLLLAKRGHPGPALDLFQISLPRFRSPPPSRVWLVFPECLAKLGEKKQALHFLGQHLPNPDIPPEIREKMEALQQRLSQ